MFVLERYKRYVSTDIAWCPEVPAHWEVRRNKNVMRRVAELVRTDSPKYKLLSLTKLGVIARDLSTIKGKMPASFDTYQALNQGDLIMCLFDVDETPRTVGIVREPGMITGAYDRFVVRDPSTAEYLNWFYVAVDNIKGLRPLYRGLRKTVPIETFLSAHVPIPPQDERAAIVKYLAYANGRIDRAISAKRRLVALLDESDRAIVNQLLANPGREPKGRVPSLDSLPETWDVVRAKRIFREVDRRSSTGSEGLLSLRMREGLVDAEKYTTTPIPPTGLVGYKIVNPGEIVMNRMRASIGLFGVAQISGLVSPDYSTMTVADGVDPEFYLLFFKTDIAMSEFRKRSTGLGTGSSGFMRLYYEGFGSVPMPMPSLEEQRRIVATVSTERAKIGPVVARTQREIKLLQEFRTRLVADVVTGQANVSAIAASLPDGDASPNWLGNGGATGTDSAEFMDVIEANED